MSDLTGIALTLVLLLANAFFVGAEFSLISARRSIIEPKALEGSWAAKVTLSAMEQVSLMLAGAQLGVTVCSLALGAISSPRSRTCSRCPSRPSACRKRSSTRSRS